MTHKATGNFVSFLSLSFVCMTFELFFELKRICATSFFLLSIFLLVLFTVIYWTWLSKFSALVKYVKLIMTMLVIACHNSQAWIKEEGWCQKGHPVGITFAFVNACPFQEKANEDGEIVVYEINCLNYYRTVEHAILFFDELICNCYMSNIFYCYYPSLMKKGILQLALSKVHGVWFSYNYCFIQKNKKLVLCCPVELVLVWALSADAIFCKS